MDYRKLAQDLFDNTYRLKGHNHQQKIDESMQGEIFALLFIRELDRPVLPSEISNQMNISSARVAVILNNLDKKGLIKREIDESDRRRILVSLTDKGIQESSRHFESVIKLIEKMLRLLGETDAKEFVRITEKIVDLSPQMVKKEVNNA